MHSMTSASTRLTLSQIESEVKKLGEQREILARAIKDHETRGPSYVSSIPFKFFEDLHREHSRILSLLNSKIEETENLAKAYFTQARGAQPQEQ